MSVVAVKINPDYVEICSDSICIMGHTQRTDQDKEEAKLFVAGNLVVGGVGSAEELCLFKQFLTHYKTKPLTTEEIVVLLCSFNEWLKDKFNLDLENDYIFVDKLTGKVFSSSGYYVTQIKNYEAIGAGCYHASTALYLGHSAKDAVRVACKLTIYCELPLHSHRVKTNGKKK
jgi:ATP-dependent protease HslVU (ClpYQ) peptidase subunit